MEEKPWHVVQSVSSEMMKSATILIELWDGGARLLVQQPNPEEYMKPFLEKDYGTYWELICADRHMDAIHSVLETYRKTVGLDVDQELPPEWWKNKDPK